jgi:hypothetical protein
MLETMKPTPTAPPRAGTLVVLLASDILGGSRGLEALCITISSGLSNIRLLFRIAHVADFELIESLAAFDLPKQVLLAHGISAPDGIAEAVQMPPGSEEADLNELALALSDVVIYDADLGEKNKLVLLAKHLEKLTVSLGQALPDLPVIGPSITSGLDPQFPGWLPRGPGFFGRFEQFILELFAFNWQRQDGTADSIAKMKKCLGWSWRPQSYFAPSEWKKLDPDQAAVDDSAPIVARFEALDRSALRGSYLHRDLIWFVHLGAAYAVFLAVYGEIAHAREPNSQHNFWDQVFSSTGFELLVLLLIVALVLSARLARLQDRWTACRLGAEQLRIARMCLPLLMAPPALRDTRDKPRARRPANGAKSIAAHELAAVQRIAGHQMSSKDPPPPPDTETAEELTFRALAEGKRAVRDQGLPRVPPDFTSQQAAKWLKFIVADQAKYHDDNFRKLEHAEKNLHFFTAIFFGVSILGVCGHFIGYSVWLLLSTAVGPAFAAALHGAGTRLGIVHRTALSKKATDDLMSICRDLEDFIAAPSVPEEAWPKLRVLALEAADAMGEENLSWHGLVRRERDVLPA